MQKLQATIKQHQRENRDLLKMMNTDGINLDEKRKINHHFCAPSLDAAESLQTSLEILNPESIEIEPMDDEEDDADGDWSVTLEMLQSPEDATSDEILQVLVSSAIEHECEYEGWGTLVESPEASLSEAEG